AHLFAAFVPAAYRPHPHHPSPWSAQQGQETLAFLARHLEYNLGGTPDLAWWHLHKALARHRLGLVAGLTSGLMFGLAFELAFGLALGLSGDLALGLTVGLIIGLIPAIASGYLSWAVAERMSKVDADPSAGIRWAPDWSRFKGLPLLILAGVFAGGLVAGGLHAGLQTAFVTVLVYGLIFAIENGLSSVPSDLATSVGPSAVLARDRRTFWTIGLTTWLLTGLVTGLGVGLAGGLVTGLGVGLWAGLLLGLLLALARSVWWKFVVARFVLAARGRVPWRLMGFLADAHERRGVLRQAGAVYQFRHLDLQRHLAERRP
ncbi:NACHT domain-containing protein, partial [Streptomyces sp. FH025]|nr:NACHT domain-containing protein [Streptomyces sp. FH025]